MDRTTVPGHRAGTAGSSGRVVVLRTLRFALRRALVAGLAAALLSSAVARGPEEEEDLREAMVLSSDLRVRVRDGREIVLETLAQPGETWAGLAARLTGRADHGPALRAWNGDTAPEAGGWVAIPLLLVEGSYRDLVLRTVFPRDRLDESAWVHRVRDGELSTYAEGMWQVAEWFTGRGDRFEDLIEVNRLATAELRRGQEVRIPLEWLHASLRPGERSDDGALEFGSDAQGPYAGYRLRSGEALYSAVVVRFTGRTDAEDVVALAEELGARSGIRDLRDIPVGYLVKIPLDDLEPQFLPRGHPRRNEAEARRDQLARELEARPVPTARGLEGVLVILDPGHGGRDLGTIKHGIWEHDYVYDVSCRLKRILERESGAEVFLTLADQQSGCRPSDASPLEANLQGTIRTHPPFLARENGLQTRIAVNLRWYLANSVYRKAVREGRDGNRVVFVSVHADSRHPSLDGVMVYVPGADYRTRTYGHTSATYTKYAEVREKPTVRFSKKARIRSEAVSRKLAVAIVEGFRREKLAVQKNQPVRNRIVRSRRNVFVPAVIRNNEVPASVLVELANMGNKSDAGVLAGADGRERMARALARGLFDYFGEEAPDSLASR